MTLPCSSFLSSSSVVPEDLAVTPINDKFPAADATDSSTFLVMVSSVGALPPGLAIMLTMDTSPSLPSSTLEVSPSFVGVEDFAASTLYGWVGRQWPRSIESKIQSGPRHGICHLRA